jgi:septal ring factor EnvC (AmiA/AmiB activator)
VRKGRRVRLTWATCVIISMGLVGCAKAPTCKVSPVELEELREDVAVLKKDLKSAQDREATLTADLAAKQATLADRRTKPDSLRAQLEQVKKGVGKTEKAKETPAKATTNKQPGAAPAATTPPARTPPAATTPPAKTPPPAAAKAPAPAPKDSTKTPPPAKAPASAPKDTTKAPAKKGNP